MMKIGSADGPSPTPGPLAGLDRAAAHRPGAAFVLSAAADCPFPPRDLATRLDQARVERNAPLASAASIARR
jgi:molybdopterin-guanine dinucleotide biosynthesis protein A